MIFCCFLFACQKGIHWDLDSKGSLVKDDFGNCSPVAVSGLYVADSIVNANNFITVDVDVTEVGVYKIFTDSINGIVFKASGEFTNTGVNHVKLLCSGKPVAADTTYFTITYNTSVCEAAVVVNTNAIPPAEFSLQGAPGDCLNDSVIGLYTKGILLDTTNKVSISVNVINAGRYTINTNAVNGYSFSASGVFENSGIQNIILYPTGTPVNDGIDIFKVDASSSSCNLQVKVNSDDAEFTLQGSPGKCMDDSVMGTYVKGVGMDTFSKVTISVNVTVPGKYGIVTNTVNGYSFTGGGAFTTTGVQTITLYAKGIPTADGTDIFTVTAGSTSCTFDVVVLPGVVQVTNNDLFPLTDGSYWHYQDLFNTDNSFDRTITGDSSVNGKTYKVLHEVDIYNRTNESLYLKNGYDYYEYATEDKYTESFKYAKNNYTELFFLKEYPSQNETWVSPEFKDEATFGQTIILKYDYKCLRANGVVTVNGKAFADVCIIEMRPEIRTLTDPWGYTNEVYTWYYARGVGLIYYKAISNFNYRKAEMQITDWQVK